MKVNECGWMELQNEISEAAIRYRELSKIEKWKLDISWIQDELKYPLKDLELTNG